MALTESNPLAIGTIAPDFNLVNTKDGLNASLNELKGEKGTVIMFICNHCPFVIHVNPELVQLANDYSDRGIAFIAISGNNVETHPQDGPEHMKIHAKEMGYPFPYLYDETQEVAKAYDAACTPDFYLFDGDLKSTYHGQLDSSRPGNDVELNGVDLRNAIDALLANDSPVENQLPSIGCNIKWK